MVAITTLTGLALHTGGSAAHPARPPAAETSAAADTPATIVTLSDRAQQLVAEAKAAQKVGDIFALANGVAASGAGTKTHALIAHDVQTNDGLYIVWSSVR
ncbi:MAG: hypothetical protein RO009_19165 [Pseudorhodoplanes sp.]|jgi:hypothetical protein|nr:hypothetical protein [Pseudorhodoplanes sp.]